ncbi:hypothetical protein TSOC_000018 [Tetrabaena socialis]|uniref:BACK domain-containing protein n=1 Tax=Tetrabaena socialis TaxID=47790 RepID=A0A2J8AKC0_9CHLO|nr:hypothetical protein TSOC_000018 [Tetrabaena socialis]|eukprot:PNH12962.1 hypothetical protein TSOC_000018 [Tetrabaena socialis]
MFPGSAFLAKAVAEEFGRKEGSDCVVVFYVTCRERVRERVRDYNYNDNYHDYDYDYTPKARMERMVERNVGDPLPCHKFVLRRISEMFKAKIDSWNTALAATFSLGPPELRVSINSTEDEPSARAAIGVGYTGRVQADSSMQEVLGLRRMGRFLQIDGCAAACDEFIMGRLQAANGSGSNNSSGSSAVDVDGQNGGPQPPVHGPGPVLEFFSVSNLFPDPAEDLEDSSFAASFAPVLAASKQALVRHFRDTLAVLNTPALAEQFLDLPAVAVEALLESDDFGTDTESSVLLLLARWTKVNFGKTGAADRKRLCRLVRLVQLGRRYLTFILPALAADFEAGADEGLPGAWFPISCMEAAFIASLSSASNSEQRELKATTSKLHDITSPWYSITARPPCSPAGGLTFGWSIAEQELRLALQALGPDQQHKVLYGAFAAAPSVYSHGFQWRPCIKLEHAKGTAGAYLTCELPGAYDGEGSRISADVVSAGSLRAQLTVNRWRNGVRQNAYTGTLTPETYVQIGGQWGKATALGLRPPPEGGGANVLEAWADYLHGGEITGGLKLIFGSEEDADSVIIFYAEELRGQDGAEASKVERAVGDPLPCHKFVLRCMSERFRAKIDRWDGSGPKDVRLELRVSLNSEDEEPSARAAIGVGYTGRVQADSMREVLRIRCQGAYLQIDGCAAACDEFITARLQAESSSSSGVGVGGHGQPPVLEFFSVSDLFPDPAEGASGFAAVLSAAQQALVCHFRDTLAVLNTPALTEQFLALPAVAVEGLLESDDFGTDAESSVLLLLAAWTKANFEETDAAARERLCRLVRLVQLGRPYLASILPALAADFEAGADEGLPGAWFPISCMEAAFLASLSLAVYLSSLPNAPASDEQKQLRESGAEMYNLTSPWYSFTARRQCTPAAGLTFDWSIAERELELALQALRPGQTSYLYGVFAGGMSSICASGFQWRPCIKLKLGEGTAGFYILCELPRAYDVGGSRVRTPMAGVVSLNATPLVHCWGGGGRQDAVALNMQPTTYCQIGNSRGNASALRLRPLPAAGGPNPTSAAWADYLQAGRITGSLKLLPPPAS